MVLVFAHLHRYSALGWDAQLDMHQFGGIVLARKMLHIMRTRRTANQLKDGAPRRITRIRPRTLPTRLKNYHAYDPRFGGNK